MGFRASLYAVDNSTLKEVQDVIKSGNYDKEEYSNLRDFIYLNLFKNDNLIKYDTITDALLETFEDLDDILGVNNNSSRIQSVGEDILCGIITDESIDKVMQNIREQVWKSISSENTKYKEWLYSNMAKPNEDTKGFKGLMLSDGVTWIDGLFNLLYLKKNFDFVNYSLLYRIS